MTSLGPRATDCRWLVLARRPRQSLETAMGYYTSTGKYVESFEEACRDEPRWTWLKFGLLLAGVVVLVIMFGERGNPSGQSVTRIKAVVQSSSAKEVQSAPDQTTTQEFIPDKPWTADEIFMHESYGAPKTADDICIKKIHYQECGGTTAECPSLIRYDRVSCAGSRLVEARMDRENAEAVRAYNERMLHEDAIRDLQRAYRPRRSYVTVPQNPPPYYPSYVIPGSNGEVFHMYNGRVTHAERPSWTQKR